MNLQLRKDIAEAYHSNPQKIRVMNFFLTEMLEKRKPLSEGAGRTGRIGCKRLDFGYFSLHRTNSK